MTEPQIENDPPLDHLPPPAGRTLPMAFAAWVLTAILGLIAFSILSESGQEMSDLMGRERIAVALPIALGIAAAALVLAAPGGDPLRALRLRTFRSSDIAVGLVVGAVSQIALVPLYWPILRFSDGDVGEPAEKLVAAFPDNEIWLLVGLVFFLAPFTEELFYRGLVQGSLERSMGPWKAIAISSVIFGVVHAQLLQLPGLVFIGAVSGYALWRYQRLWLSIAIHMGFNGITAIQLVSDRFG